MERLQYLYPSPIMRDVIVMCAFLSVCGASLAGPVMLLAAVLPPRVAAFAVSVILCWLFVDNITLAFDLADAVSLPQTSTQAEVILLRRLRVVNHQINLVLAQLGAETVSHGRTAMRLDVLEDRFRDGVHTAMHWSLLASKVIVLERLERLANSGEVGTNRWRARHKTTDDCYTL